jgi:hypothetical protein
VDSANERAVVLREWFLKGKEPAFNTENVEYARYYQQVANKAIGNYKGMLARGEGSSPANIAKNIALQQQRLEAISEWLIKNGLKP